MNSKKAILFALPAILLWACASPKPLPPPPPPPVVALPPKPPPDNLEIVDYEIVEGPEQDWLARTRIFVDRTFVGQTEEAPRSREKRWTGRVAAGNRLVRLERWTFPRVWDWVKTPEDDQPAERFIRVRPGKKTLVRLKLSDQGRERALEISESPLAAD